MMSKWGISSLAEPESQACFMSNVNGAESSAGLSENRWAVSAEKEKGIFTSCTPTLPLPRLSCMA